MATFNKPGVYIQEVLSPNLPITSINGASVGAFIGIADRGPTAVVNGTVVGVPTLVSSWDEFVNTFSFGAVANAFSPDIFGANPNPNFLGTATSDLKNAVYTFFANGGANAYIGRKVNASAAKASVTVADNQGVTTIPLGSSPDVTTTTTLVSASGATTVLVATTTGIVSGQLVTGTGINSTATVSTITSVVATSKSGTAASGSATVTIAPADILVGQVVSHASIPVGTYVTVVGASTITLSATTSAAITTGNLTFTLNTLTLSAANTSGGVALGSTLSFDGTRLSFSVDANQITITGTTFSNTLLNNVVSFSGISTTNSTVDALLSSPNSFVVTSVFGGGIGITLAYSGTAVSGGATQTSGTVTITGTPSASTSAALVISANSHGAWGNNIWVGVTPNQTPNYFDLTVYYGTDATITASTATSSSLSSSNIVEIIPQLSLNPSDARFVTNIVNSNWITVSVNAGTASNPATRVPAFTSTWQTASANATGSANGTFKWSSNGVVTGTTAVRLGGYGVTLTYTASNTSSAAISTSSAGTIFSTTTSFVARTVGVAGTGTGDPTIALQQFDAVENQLILNYPNAFDSTTITKITDYAASRGDSFAVIDPGTVYTTPTALTTALDGLNIANQNYGAVYFPNLTIADPASTVVGKTINVAPGGSVVAEYSATDTSVGAFKSPAGITNNIGGAVPVTTLLSTDFDIISSALKNVNIIRTVPGYGTCIMGARTIGSAYSDKYISVRRTLNYLEYNLKNNTQFAVFEPNDANLWSDVAAVASGILNDYWSKGGLAGATADQAFYVKCDSTINTPTTIGAGELHLEVGVALQRPAEFVVIKIGQINGGTTVTTTL
jgi:phage tail sheath protein FI